jgi:predicted RND superfamily exporter protein
MKEMGIVTGGGLVVIMIATFLCLPALLVLREKRIKKRIKDGKLRKKDVSRDISFIGLGSFCGYLGRKYFLTITAAVLGTIMLTLMAFRIKFDQNYMNMEPKGLLSVDLQDVILEKFDLGIDYALILADDVSESNRLSDKIKDRSSVASVEDISVYLPSPEEQKKRIPHVREIRKNISKLKTNKIFGREEMRMFLRELERLEMNVMEMQDMAYLGGQDKVDNKCSEITGDPENPESVNIIRNLINAVKNDNAYSRKILQRFQRYFSPYYKRTVMDMSSGRMLEISDLPESILDRYSNKSRSHFLVTVFPSMNIWTDLKFLDRFSDELERVSEKATGMPIIFRALLEVIGKDGRNAVMLTVIIVFLLLWLDFRNPVDGLIAMIPLVTGMLWMVGFMKVFGMKLTVMNVMGLPLILGIGIDDGVHIVHRWKVEGNGAISKVFSSTGKAILLTSLTTMLAFGALSFSIWRGFASLGTAMFIGVGACFLTTVIILSSIMGLASSRKSNKE